MGRKAIGIVYLLSLAGCKAVLSDHDDVYSRGADHFVLCSNGIDDKFHVSVDEINDALSRAKAEGTTLHLYAHVPDVTIPIATIDRVLAAATERGVVFTTYEELNDHEVPGSLALSFDDDHVASWIQLRPTLAKYQAQVTFFVTRFGEYSDETRAQLRQLSDDGHDIEYHATAHLNAEDYSAEHGLDAYIADEILPGLQAMRAAGYQPTVFAYPFGARNAATDEALMPYFAHLRGTRSRCPR